MMGGERPEGMSFGDAALRLMALMARLCGWRPDEFWAATPAETEAVLMGFSQGESVGGQIFGDGVGRGRLAAMMEAFPDG